MNEPRAPLGHDVLTPWFPEGVKPVRKGTYERKCGEHSTSYSNWTGVFWSVLRKNVEPDELANVRSVFQELPWRGLHE